MKKLSGILSIMMLLFVFSCAKDKDTSPAAESNVLDTKGSFEMTFGDKTYSGSEVTFANAIGVQTIEAVDGAFTMTILIGDDLYKEGKVFDLSESEIAPLISIDLNGDGVEEGYWGIEGTLTVVSKTKIEVNAGFYENFLTTNPKFTTTGFISAK